MRAIPVLGLVLVPSILPSLLPSADPPEPWTREQAWDWYRKTPWLCGFNYVPSTAGNTTELWQAETFDEPTIDRELGWAHDIGFNTARVFIQHLVWKHDPDGLKERIDRFLSVADRHGILATLVLFDDCAFGDPPVTEPYVGKQRDPIPGMILSNWTPSPGLKAVVDRALWPDLERYVTDVVGTFGMDRRVVLWDLYNEPGNSGMGTKSLPLVEATFSWARKAGPTQPLTISISGAPAELDRVQLALSDVPSFHAYTDAGGLRAAIARLRVLRRPIVCTEWMARLQGSRWETDLPHLKGEAVGCYAWGFVNGRGQCQFPWWSKRGDPEPAAWFHDLLHRDGRPYRPEEVEAIRRTTAEKRIDVDAAERYYERLGAGVIDDTDPRVAYSGAWTLWTGAGPLGDTLHYSKERGASAEVEFEGTGISLLHKVGPDCGIAEVLIDGKPVPDIGGKPPVALGDKPAAKIEGLPAAGAGGGIEAEAGGGISADAAGQARLDTHGPAVDWNREVRIARGLKAGPHVLTVVVTGERRTESTEAWVQVVAFRVEGGSR